MTFSSFIDHPPDQPVHGASIFCAFTVALPTTTEPRTPDSPDSPPTLLSAPTAIITPRQRPFIDQATVTSSLGILPAHLSARKNEQRSCARHAEYRESYSQLQSLRHHWRGTCCVRASRRTLETSDRTYYIWATTGLFGG